MDHNSYVKQRVKIKDQFHSQFNALIASYESQIKNLRKQLSQFNQQQKPSTLPYTAIKGYREINDIRRKAFEAGRVFDSYEDYLQYLSQTH